MRFCLFRGVVAAICIVFHDLANRPLLVTIGALFLCFFMLCEYFLIAIIRCYMFVFLFLCFAAMFMAFKLVWQTGRH